MEGAIFRMFVVFKLGCQFLFGRHFLTVLLVYAQLLNLVLFRMFPGGWKSIGQKLHEVNLYTLNQNQITMVSKCAEPIKFYDFNKPPVSLSVGAKTSLI